MPEIPYSPILYILDTITLLVLKLILRKVSMVSKRSILYAALFSMLSFSFSACCFDCGGNETYHSELKCGDYRYLSFEELNSSIAVVAPREIEKAAKIYTYGDWLLVNERNKGIHIIDNSNRTNPTKKAFIQLWGNLDIAIKDGYLYADSFSDLVVFDFRDIDNIKVVTKKEKVFPMNNYQAISSDDYSFWYDKRCGFDSSKGVVVEVKK